MKNPRLSDKLSGSELSEYEQEKIFNASLDEDSPMIEALGVKVEPSEFLKTHDEVAYREAFNNWLDGSETLTEYEGEWYHTHDFKACVEELVSELDDEQSELTTKLDQLEGEMDDLRVESDNLSKQISELNDL